jgi:hypothetical protein
VSDDYLWDRTGDPDPEVEELERLLSPLRHQARPLDFDAVPAEPPRASHRGWWPLALAAAALIVVLGGAWLATRGRPIHGVAEREEAGWDVARLEGSPRLGPREVAGRGRWAVGEWLETDGISRARVRIGAIGYLDVEPNTRLRLVGTGPQEHRLALAHGAIGADVIAPPRLFLVETPAALAVDLGCTYTLEVDAAGGGLLRVTRGFVSLEQGARQSYVPAGAICRMRPGHGPGTPRFADAPATLQAALDAFDFDGPTAESLAIVLGAARPMDGLTLWHLLARVDPSDRGGVYDRLAELVPPPGTVSREGVLRLDAAELEAWKTALERGWPVSTKTKLKKIRGGK